MASVRDVITRNREAAQKALDGSLLEHIEPVVNVSVAWFRIKDPAVKATDLQAHLARYEVYVLPGTYFYWSEPERGERYLRVALARDPGDFRASVERLREAVDSYAG
ncbi:hypothetical protein ACFQ2B_22380 [Streptomyces stramineus]